MFTGISRHAAVALLLALSMAACTKADLAFRPQKGESKTYHVESTLRNRMKAKVSGEGMGNVNQNVDQDQTRTFDITFEVTDVQPTATTLKVTYGDISSSMKGGAGNEAFAMPGEVAEMDAKLEALLEGKSFTAKIGPKGSVVDVAGLTELSQSVRQAVTEGVSGMLSGAPSDISGKVTDLAVKQAAGGLANPDHVRQWLENIFAYFPPQETRVGSSWSETDHMPGEFPLEVARKYTFAGLDGPNAAIRFSSDAKSDKQSTTAIPFLEQMNLSGSGGGNAKLDQATGWPVEVDEKLDLSGDLKMDPNMPIPVKIDASVSLNLTSEMKIRQKP